MPVIEDCSPSMRVAAELLFVDTVPFSDVIDDFRDAEAA